MRVLSPVVCLQHHVHVLSPVMCVPSVLLGTYVISLFTHLDLFFPLAKVTQVTVQILKVSHFQFVSLCSLGRLGLVCALCLPREGPSPGFICYMELCCQPTCPPFRVVFACALRQRPQTGLSRVRQLSNRLSGIVVPMFCKQPRINLCVRCEPRSHTVLAACHGLRCPSRPPWVHCPSLLPSL